MKKLFTLCAFALGITASVSAQQLATFEDGADNKLAVDGWWDPVHFVVGPSIMDNPSKSGLNTSNKCFGAVNVANADWWGNFGPLKLSSPIEITEANRYLKIQVYRSIQPKQMVLYFNTLDTEIWRGTISEDGKWVGMVFDLGEKYMGQELTDLIVCFSANWDDPRSGWGVGTYAFDNYSLGSDPLPDGVTPITDLSGFNVGFESESVTNQWISKFDMLHESNSYAIVDNPVKDAVNTSDKVAQFNKGAEASWWRGFRTEFNGAFEVSSDYKYLHTMVYVPEAALDGRESVDVQLCAKDFTGAENTEIKAIWDDEVDGWIDVVMDVNKIKYITELTVRFDIRKDAEDNYISSPANTFYLDGIVLNNDPNPREHIGNSLNEVENLADVTITGGDNNIAVLASQTVTVKVYNTMGALISKTTSDAGQTSISASAGVYIVKVESVGGQKIAKVLVK